MKRQDENVHDVMPQTRKTAKHDNIRHERISGMLSEELPLKNK